MKRTRTWVACAALGALAGAFVAGPTARAQNATSSSLPSLSKAAASPDNWAIPALNYASTRYSPLNQINASNASHLQVAWTFSTGVLRGHEGQPLVIGNVMYLVTPFPNTVYALDLNNHERILWQYTPTQNPEVIPVMCCDTVNRGVAYGDGKIILHQADNTVVALDAKTGKVDWTTALASYKVGATGTEAPLVIGDKVIVGVSGGEFGVNGFVAALSMTDGHILWKAYSEGPDNMILLNPKTTMSLGKPVGRGGWVCRDSVSASISGASAVWFRYVRLPGRHAGRASPDRSEAPAKAVKVMLPRAAAGRRSKRDPASARQGSNAAAGGCRSPDTARARHAPRRRYRRPASRPPHI